MARKKFRRSIRRRPSRRRRYRRRRVSLTTKVNRIRRRLAAQTEHYFIDGTANGTLTPNTWAVLDFCGLGSLSNSLPANNTQGRSGRSILVKGIRHAFQILPGDLPGCLYRVRMVLVMCPQPYSQAIGQGTPGQNLPDSRLIMAQGRIQSFYKKGSDLDFTVLADFTKEVQNAVSGATTGFPTRQRDLRFNYAKSLNKRVEWEYTLPPTTPNPIYPNHNAFFWLVNCEIVGTFTGTPSGTNLPTLNTTNRTTYIDQ